MLLILRPFDLAQDSARAGFSSGAGFSITYALFSYTTFVSKRVLSKVKGFIWAPSLEFSLDSFS